MDNLRKQLEQRAAILLDPLVVRLARTGLTPDMITVSGLIISAVAAAFLAAGHLLTAGIIWLLGSALDMFDGALARRTNTVNSKGAFLDSSLDRVSEGLFFTAAAYHFAAQNAPVAAALATFALLASLMVSYTRARAEGLGTECKTGLATRAERVILLGVGLVLDILHIALAVLAVLAAFTTIQRIMHVRAALDRENHAGNTP